MELTKCKLGELITQRREKNDGSDLPICGISKDGLIPPKQKDADTSIYNVFYRDDFIFNPARMELNSIAINDMYDRAICSSLYEVFYVHRTDLLLPHYLELIIRQKWFTRYCKFLGQGSAREYCRFGNISEIEIEFPPIEEQQKIVEYNTAIENRIALKQKINDNLEAQANAIFSSSAPDFTDLQPIHNFGTVITGKTPPTSVAEYYGNDIPFIKTPDMHGNVYITSSECSLSKAGADSQKNKYIPENTVVVACIGANAGEVALTSYIAQTNQQINAIISKYPCFLYFSIKAHTVELRTLGEGSSTMININKTSFENYEIPTPSDNTLQQLEHKLNIIFSAILHNLQEIDRLNETKDLLVTQLSR